MKTLLADKKIQRLITWTVGVMILAIIIVLVIIPGIQDSQFSKIKKYNSDKSLGEALKRKQQIADSRYYQTEGFVESESASIYRVGDFTVNVRGNKQQKLILNLSVQYGNSDVPSELASKNPIIRNAIISTVSDAQYLQSRKGKDLLKERLKKDLNGVVNSGEITEVYFNQFIIQ
jgi:flagellar FliL protein